jgi:hypothetical protein
MWVVLLSALIIHGSYRADNGAPLALSYFFGLSLIHVPGLLAFMGSGFSSGEAERTASGFQMTLIGMAAFVVSVVLTSNILKRRAATKPSPQIMAAPNFGIRGWTICIAGLTAYFVVLPLSFSVSSLTAPIASLGVLIVVGAWVELFRAKFTLGVWNTLGAFGLALLLPFSTVVSSGFIGFGTYWALSVAIFYFVIANRRRWYILAAPLGVYVGLSFFVTYMDQRDAIRESIWQRQAPISERITQVSELFTEFQWLDLDSRAHTSALDERLNQNWLVAAGVRRHRDGLTELAYGSTVPWWAPIPRALWPGKPEIGGGGDIVARYTGVRFGPNTSVGVGQVLEFYINFGLPGVIIGFVGLGILLAWLDRKIMTALGRGDLRVLLLTAMPGLSLLQPGGNLLEIVVGTVSAIILSRLIVVLLNNLGVQTSKSPIARTHSEDGRARELLEYR